jgi:hypothetical protein
MPSVNSDDSGMESDSISEVASDDEEDSDEVNEIYKSRSTAVFRLRLVVILATFLVAVGVSIAIYFVMEDTEK